MKEKPKNRNLYLDGMSPQQVIKHMRNLINHTPEPYKAFLRVEEYTERYGNPFSDGERTLRLVCYKED